jgi:hypothetical protein
LRESRCGRSHLIPLVVEAALNVPTSSYMNLDGLTYPADRSLSLPRTTRRSVVCGLLQTALCSETDDVGAATPRPQRLWLQSSRAHVVAVAVAAAAAMVVVVVIAVASEGLAVH